MIWEVFIKNFKDFLNDFLGVYNATKHPDVISGKKTEDEILGEFLDTFEVHHANIVNFLINLFKKALLLLDWRPKRKR